MQLPNEPMTGTELKVREAIAFSVSSASGYDADPLAKKIMAILREVVEDCALIAVDEASPETARRLRVKYGVPLPARPTPHRRGRA